MNNIGIILRQEEIEFFLRLWGGIISLPPPDPPFDIKTMEPETLPPGWEIPVLRIGAVASKTFFREDRADCPD